MAFCLMDITHVIASPVMTNMIDAVNPETGRGLYSGETLDQIRARYPGAEILTFDDFTDRAYARQNPPLTWHPVTRATFEDMRDVLPPAAWRAGAFLVGEPDDHCARTGQPRYRAYRRAPDGVCECASRPMTIAEFRAVTS